MHRGAVADLARDRGRQPAALSERRQRPHPLQRGVTAGTLVDGHPVDRFGLGIETALVDGLDRSAMALQRVDLHVLAADVPLLCDHLRAPELRHLLGAVTLNPALRSGEGIGVTQRLGRDQRSADGHHRHVLHASGDNHVVDSGLDRHCGEADRLLARSALPVDRHARHGFGQTRRQPARAGDITGVGADVVEVAEDHILHGHGIDVGASQQRLDRRGAQIGRVDLRQSPASPARGRAHRIDDVGLAHRWLLDRLVLTVDYAAGLGMGRTP